MQISHKALVIFALFPLLTGLTGCQNNPKNSLSVDSATYAARESQLHFEVIAPQSRHDLYRHFTEYNYTWNTVNQGVPPLIVEKFPDDFYELTAGSERTKTFYLILLPMILLINEEITSERNTLLELFSRHDSKENLNAREIDQVTVVAQYYKVDRHPLSDLRARALLLNRLDKIPPSLALAQAACESAYGTSRFARLGNNLFGELVFTANAEGIIPLNKEANYRARVFPTLLDSLRAYMLNLNTHPAYQELRQMRAEMQMRGENIRGIELARGLQLYSTRKEAYVEDIRAIIRAHNLPKHTANASLRRQELNSSIELQTKLPSFPAENIPLTSAAHFDARDLLGQN